MSLSKYEGDFICNLNLINKIKRSVILSNEFLNRHIVSLRPLQVRALKSIAARNDLMVCLPTGYGKSVIYEMTPYVELVCHNVQDGVTVVVSLLNALIGEQCEKLAQCSIPADSLTRLRLLPREALFIVGHPETMLQDDLRETMIGFCDRVRWIVIDEAHCVLQWGPSFRTDYGQLHRLRALFTHAKVIAMTASATERARGDISKNLLLQDADTVNGSCDRPNIYLSAMLRPPSTGGDYVVEDSYMQALTTMFGEICSKGLDMPKTVVYCKLKWVGFAYDFFHQQFAIKQHEEGCGSIVMVSQYHASCTDTVS